MKHILTLKIFSKRLSIISKQTAKKIRIPLLCDFCGWLSKASWRESFAACRTNRRTAPRCLSSKSGKVITFLKLDFWARGNLYQNCKGSHLQTIYIFMIKIATIRMFHDSIFPLVLSWAITTLSGLWITSYWLN